MIAPAIRSFRHNLRLVEGYAGGSYPGRLLLFRAEGSHFRDPEDSTLGWAPFVSGGVDLRQLPGNHWAMVQSPAVEGVSAALTLYYGVINLTPKGRV